MVDVKLKSRERELLQSIVSGEQDARLVRRAYALLWLSAGASVDETALRLAVTRQTIYNWAGRYLARERQPVEARLADGPRSGRPCTAQGIIDSLIEGVIDTDPRLLGFNSTVWTAPLLKCYLHNEHHIDVSRQSVRLAIARLRMRWKRPRYQLALRPTTWQQAKGG